MATNNNLLLLEHNSLNFCGKSRRAIGKVALVIVLLVVIAIASGATAVFSLRLGTTNGNSTTTTSSSRNNQNITISMNSNETSSKSLTITPSVPYNVLILSRNVIVDRTNYSHVIGIVKNSGNVDVAFPQLTATFYYSNGTIALIEQGYPDFQQLAPGQYSPFDIVSPSANTLTNFANYTVEFTIAGSDTLLGKPFCPCPYNYSNLQIFNLSSHTDGSGFFHVLGEVLNNGAAQSNFTEVAGTFYNQTGALIGEASAHLSPGSLSAGQNAQFNLEVANVAKNQTIASYQLWAGGKVGVDE